MKSITLKIIALVGAIALVALLWPIFTQAETSLAFVFVVASFTVIGIAALALFSKKRWMMWAVLGVWPGAILGGLMFAGIGLLTIGDGNNSFEGLVVGAIIILGTFIGAVAGAVTGGLLGARRERREALHGDSTSD